MEGVRAKSIARKRQITLAHLRDSVLATVEATPGTAAQDLFASSERRGSQKELLSTADFQAGLSRLKPVEGAPSAQDVAAAFATGTDDTVSFKAFADWWSTSVASLQSQPKEAAAPAPAAPPRQGKDDEGKGEKGLEDKDVAPGKGKKPGAKAEGKEGEEKGERKKDEDKRQDKEEDDRRDKKVLEGLNAATSPDSDQEDNASDYYEYSKDMETREVRSYGRTSGGWSWSLMGLPTHCPVVGGEEAPACGPRHGPPRPGHGGALQGAGPRRDGVHPEGRLRDHPHGTGLEPRGCPRPRLCARSVSQSA